MVLTQPSAQIAREVPARHVRDDLAPQENAMAQKGARKQSRRLYALTVHPCRFHDDVDKELRQITVRWRQRFSDTIRDLVSVGLEELKKRGDL